MKPVRAGRRVPGRALALSVAALGVPLTSQWLFPAFAGGEYGFLVWTSALIPAFLLAYHWGLRGVAVAAAAGMAVLSLTQAGASALGVGMPDERLVLVGVAVYLIVCANVAVVTELMHRERTRAEQLALLDALTGLPNRRHVEFTLDMQVAAAARGRPLAVILFDIDHFKQINDTRGHKVGDLALKAFADVLKRRTRRMDFVGRYGGEEFVAVLTDCPAEPAARFADRVRTDLRGRTFAWGRMTVSAGVAGYQQGMASHELLIAAADRALYQAKEKGRDRVELAPAPTPPPPPPEPKPEARARGAETGRVLVVDDDRDVLRAVTQVLEAARYTVEGTTSPQAAIARYESGADPFDLVVTDVLMPDITGMVMVDLLLGYKPELRVVYMSGYVQKGGVTWAGLPGAVVGFVPKPIEMQDLLNTVKEVLTRPLPVAT